MALLLALLALMLLSAIAAGMMFMSSTETAIGSNFKAEETAYFAARAGIEEMRDRMFSDPNITVNLPNSYLQIPPFGLKAIYLLGNGVTMANVTDPTKKQFDDELCHDFPLGYGGMMWTQPNVRCSTVPSVPGWYTNVTSTAPFAGTGGALEYQWVRVTLKADSSSPYWVDGNSANQNNLVCWNSPSETVAPALTNCNAMAGNLKPVYLLTSLAITPSGARRMIQEEVAQQGFPTLPGGLFATGTGCPALQIGGGAQTGSFNSAAEGTPTNPPTNQTNSGGDIGANGNTFVNGSSAAVNGAISTNLPNSVGACPAHGVTVAGTPTIPSTITETPPYSPPAPPLPNPLPPVTSAVYKNTTLSPGAYGNIQLKGTVTLTGGTVAHPAVYTINSLTLNGGCTLQINGPVVINLAGIGVATVLNMTGASFSNNTYLPSDFVINYGGTDAMYVTGGGNAFAVINAPKAPITFQGGSNFYGQAVGATITDLGGTNFYWDTSLKIPPPPAISYYEIAMRELSY